MSEKSEKSKIFEKLILINFFKFWKILRKILKIFKKTKNLKVFGNCLVNQFENFPEKNLKIFQKKNWKSRKKLKIKKKNENFQEKTWKILIEKSMKIIKKIWKILMRKNLKNFDVFEKSLKKSKFFERLNLINFFQILKNSKKTFWKFSRKQKIWKFLKIV